MLLALQILRSAVPAHRGAHNSGSLSRSMFRNSNRSSTCRTADGSSTLAVRNRESFARKFSFVPAPQVSCAANERGESNANGTFENQGDALRRFGEKCSERIERHTRCRGGQGLRRRERGDHHV